MRYITFALAKGRLAKKTLSLLEQIGITCEEMKDEKTRKLIFVNEDLKLRGSGDLLGTRQSGEMEFALADIFRDSEELVKASQSAAKLLAEDPELEEPGHELLREALTEFAAF